MEIQGKTVLITGGSRGLGAALGQVLAARGARVVLVARGAPELERVVEAIRKEGGEAHGLVGDLSEPDAGTAIAGAAAALVGPIDVLVHNASTLGPTPLPLLLDTRPEDLEGVLAVNLLGPFRLTRAIGGSMALRGRGVVVSITSDAGVTAYPRWGAYGVSKAALEHLSRTFAEELRESAVRFLVVDPGEMDTRMHAEAMPEADPGGLASPGRVALGIAALLEGVEGLESGARVGALAT